MFSCRCCLICHPSSLLERLCSSIRAIKLIRTNCTIFENILLDEYEHFERLLTNLNKYLLHSENVPSQKTSDLSQLTTRLNTRLTILSNVLYEIECLRKSCSIWLKNSSGKVIRSQLKTSGKQLNIFEQHSSIAKEANGSAKKFRKDFSVFQSTYYEQCLHMEQIEREHLNLFSESIRLFSSILSSEKHEKPLSMTNIDRNLEQWNEKNRFRISWLPEEHQHSREVLDDETLLKRCSSEIEITAIEDRSNDKQTRSVYESNWSFTLPPKKEELAIPSLPHQPIETPQPIIHLPKSPSIHRVRLAIEAIERKTRHFSRERKS